MARSASRERLQVGSDVLFAFFAWLYHSTVGIRYQYIFAYRLALEHVCSNGNLWDLDTDWVFCCGYADGVALGFQGIRD